MQVIGEAALKVQDKSKQAMQRIVRKMDDINTLAQEELVELQKQNEKIMKIDTTLN